MAKRKSKVDTTVLHGGSFKSAMHEVLYSYARDGDYKHAINRIVELVESELEYENNNTHRTSS